MKRPLLWCICFYIVGIIAALEKIPDTIVFAAIFLEFFFFLFIYYKKNRRRWDSVFLILPICFVIGFLISEIQIKSHPLDLAVESKDSGIVIGEIYRVEEKEETQIWYLKHVKIKLGEASNQFVPWISAKKVIVYPKLPMQVQIGNIIQAEGQIAVFLHPTNPGQFHEYNYYKSQGFICKFYSKSTVITNKKVNTFFQFLYQKKQQILKVYQQILPEKEAGIIAAMLLGEKSYLDPDIKSKFGSNGVSHVLVVSGLHLSIIGLFLFRPLRKIGLSPIIAVSLSVSFLWVYGYFTNFSVSTQRAVMMMSLSLFGIYFGKSYDLLTSLALSAFLLLVREPLLLYDGGFLLSFSAVFGIAVCMPVFEILWTREPIQGEVKEPHWKMVLKNSFISSFSVTIMTLPIILNFFFEFSIYSLFLNLLVIPLMSILLITALFAGILGSFYLFLGKLFCGIICLILWFYEALCNGAEKLPFHTLLLGKPERQRLLLFYGIVAIFIAVCSYTKNLEKEKKKRRKIAGQILCVVLFVVLLFPVKNKQLHITVMDVGQGDGICIQNTTGTIYFIDGGSSSIKKLGMYRILPFLKSLGIKKIDYAILSHLDADHVSGIKELIQDDKYRIRVLCLPDTSFRDNAFLEMVQMAEKKGILVKYLKKGDQIKDGKLALSCLHPESSYPALSRNDSSTVISLSYGKFSMLLTGDLEDAGEKYIQQAGLLETTTLLKVAHHGSKYSTASSFLEFIMPQAAIISYGKGNSYGHPHKELLERLKNYGVKIYDTVHMGAIRVITDGKNVKLKGFRKENGK